MTKKNNLIIFDGNEVYKNRNSSQYKVVLEEECTVYVKEEIVQKIANNYNVELELIAILLAYIEYVRKTTSVKKQVIRRIEEEKLVYAIREILININVEILIDYFKSLKWHEIKAILEADSPTEMLEEII